MANNLEDMSLDSQLIVYNSSVDLTDKTPQKLTRGTTIQALGDLVLGGSKDGFLKTADGGTLSTTYKTITDGRGNNSPLELTTFGARIGGQWTFDPNLLSSSAIAPEIRLNGDGAYISLQGANSVIYTNGSIYTPRLYLTGQSSILNVSNGAGAAGQVLAKRAAGGYEWINTSGGGGATFGTFTGLLRTKGGASITYTTPQGHYTEVGDFIHIHWTAKITSSNLLIDSYLVDSQAPTSFGQGQFTAYLQNLPFAMENSAYNAGFDSVYWPGMSSTTLYFLSVASGLIGEWAVYDQAGQLVKSGKTVTGARNQGFVYSFIHLVAEGADYYVPANSHIQITAIFKK